MMCTKFASRLRMLREHYGMTQAEFADFAEVASSTIQLYESHRSFPSGIENVEKIARAHGVDPAWLVGWSDEGGPKDGEV